MEKQPVTDKKVFLYVGLPKTGSAFLRQEVFAKLDPSWVCVNPEGVTMAFQEMHMARYSPASKRVVKEAVAETLPHIVQDMVLITDMGLTGEAEDNFKQFEEITDFLVELLPGASIIITLRNQTDWLLSLYKHTTTGLGVTISQFLNFSDGKFHPSREGEFPNVDALDFDFAKKCTCYAEKFGKENIHVLFNEDMTADPVDFVRRVGRIFDCDMTGKVNFRTENRSFSALGIQLTFYKEKLGRVLGCAGDRGKEKGALNRLILWLAQFDFGKELWRDAIRKKGLSYAPAIILRRFLLKLRWNYLIVNVLDRIVYLDWDLLGKEKREMLSRHYSHLNKGLRPYFRNRRTEDRYIATDHPGS